MLIATRLFATDQQANESFKKALVEAKQGNWYGAAEEYMTAKLYADSGVLKANALKEAGLAYGKADYLYKEFNCLKQLVRDYPTQIKFQDVINREYQIGNSYFHGYRESPYSWFPWLKDKDHAIDIYETIKDQAPYAKFIPEMMLNLGELYLKKGLNDKATTAYQEVINKFPDSKQAPIAYLDQANIYVQQAEKGDGDGSRADDARGVLKRFMKKYPKRPEIQWAKDSLKKVNEFSAQREYQLALFYLGKDRSAVKRYLKNVIIKYPNTSTAQEAVDLLYKIDLKSEAIKKYLINVITNYPETDNAEKAVIMLHQIDPGSKITLKKAEGVKKNKDGINDAYKSLRSMPETPDVTLVSPENSGGKWLEPVDDLRFGIKADKADSK